MGPNVFTLYVGSAIYIHLYTIYIFTLELLHERNCFTVLRTTQQQFNLHLRAAWSTPLLSMASTRENLSSGFANNKGADQPAHPRSLISAFIIRLMESIISRLATREV